MSLPVLSSYQVPPPLPPRPATWLKITLGMATAVVLLAACGGGGPAKPSTITVRGTLQIKSACSRMSDNGFGDIGDGEQIKVTGTTGQTLAVGPLGSSSQGPSSGTCVFHFAIPGVRAGQRTYGVTVPKRGTVDFTPTEVRHNEVGLTLGGS